jgi:paraquat-inducible protein A
MQRPLAVLKPEGTVVHPPLDQLVACPECDLLLYFPAIFLPLLTFNSLGFSDTANLLEPVSNFYHQGYSLVALMTLLTAALFPLVLLGCCFILSLGLYHGRCWPKTAPLIRLYQHLEEWALLEIFLLAILVTIIKMSGNTEIVYHSGVFCFVGLALTAVTMNSVVDRDLFWRSIEQQKALMFRIIAFIGRWSMLDIFVIALLAALVDFGFFTTINVAPAATSFAVVVTLTMLAALSYDPRLMWDRCVPCSALAAVDPHSR